MLLFTLPGFLQAIERLTNLLTVTSSGSVWSPFIICIIATTTIAHLSACKFVLKGEHLSVARERIRVAMGVLGNFTKVWPGGRRTIREVKTIARELLGLGYARTPEMETNISTLFSSTSQIRGECSVKEPDYYAGFDSSRYFDASDMDTPLDLDLGENDPQHRSGYQFDITTQF